MRRISLGLLLIAIVCLLFADIEIISLNPGSEIARLLKGAFSPDFSVVYQHRQAFLNTLVFALCGISLALPLGAVLATFFHLRLVRYYCSVVRSIHEIFWVFLLIPLMGLNPLCGVLALALPYSGIFAKVFAEIYQESNLKPGLGIPRQSSSLSRFYYFILPSMWPEIKHYSLYRFECALRTSAVLGFIGLPTLGFHLETAFREGYYSEASAILYAFFVLIGTVKYWMKAKWVALYVVAACLLISKQISFSLENIQRFFSYEILPWPMRRQGVAENNFGVDFNLDEVIVWMFDITTAEIIPGAFNTLILSQIVLLGSGVLALLFFPWICNHFFNWPIRVISHYILVMLRTTPDYILAFVLILILGPSMLPAIIALSLHNGAILAQLIKQKADDSAIPLDGSDKPVNRYLFTVIPQVYGQFLAYLFYRWEVIMRESAILGLLGIYTLGFYIDSAIAEDKMDSAIIIIISMSLLNLMINGISSRLRKNVKLSLHLK